ncbi:MAG: NADH-quinone oxidoreductase subunit D [bacterium]
MTRKTDRERLRELEAASLHWESVPPEVDLYEEEAQEDRVVMNLGPYHPAMHGVLHNIVTLEGEKIVEVDPHIGYLHRAFEKLGEVYSYTQFLTCVDRMNYVSAPMNNVGWLLAVEDMMGIEAPPRAQYVRTIIVELSRIMDHLVSMGILGVDLGAFTGFLWFFHERERLYQILEKQTGARLTTAFGRIGGLARDVPMDFVDDVRDFVQRFPDTWKDFDDVLSRNRIFMDRTQGVGAISAEKALDCGFTGPNLRAAGVPYDVRKDTPYMAYEDFDFQVPTGERGDTWDRYTVRMREMLESLKIVDQAVENIPEGPYRVEDPKVSLPEKKDTYTKMESMIHHFKLVMHGVRPPAGEFYSSSEAANGELGFFIVSDGGMNPYRVHVRRPCFYYYSAVPELLVGGTISDAIAVISSLNVIAGELDC